MTCHFVTAEQTLHCDHMGPIRRQAIVVLFQRWNKRLGGHIFNTLQSYSPGLQGTGLNSQTMRRMQRVNCGHSCTALLGFFPWSLLIFLWSLYEKINRVIQLRSCCRLHRELGGVSLAMWSLVTTGNGEKSSFHGMTKCGGVAVHLNVNCSH
jgi:hypothetical protein